MCRAFGTRTRTDMIEPTHAHWEQLRRLTHAIDVRLPLAGAPPELVALRHLLPALGLVGREYATDPRDQTLRDRTVGTLDAVEVRSLSSAIEGRTTGGRRRCPAAHCGGWDVSVAWETGQGTRICTEGWHFDPVSRELRIVGGGEITARVAVDHVTDVPPLPRAKWPAKEVLLTHPAWGEAG